MWCRLNSRTILWSGYAAFAASAIYFAPRESLLSLQVPLAGLKVAVWLALIGFLAYSIHCSWKENFFRSIGAIAKLYWGKQVGADLYLGLFLAMFLIYLHQGAWVALLWLIPVLIYANLAFNAWGRCGLGRALDMLGRRREEFWGFGTTRMWRCYAAGRGCYAVGVPNW